MNLRAIIVPAGSPLLAHPTTRRLHTYPDGSVLVETAAAAAEDGGGEELPVRRGLRLPAGTRPEGHARALLRPDEPMLAYVELIGPTDAGWLEDLDALGLTRVQYQPENAYLCRGAPAAFDAARQLPFVHGVTVADSGFKVAAGVPEDGELDVTLVAHVLPDEAEGLLAELRTLPGVELEEPGVQQVDQTLYIPARVTSEGQALALNLPLVIASERREPATPEDEVVDLIIAGQYSSANVPQGSYLRYLDDRGLSGTGVTIAVVDVGVDVGHPAFAGRISAPGGTSPSWHGTFVAANAAGAYLDERDRNGFIYGLGVAPKATLLVQDNTGWGATLCQASVAAGATVQNNSWGKGMRTPMDYGAEEALYDRLARNAAADGTSPRPITLCFSAGNAGRNGLTRPKAAKNIIVTGNSENYRPEAGGTDSDDIRAVYSGSSPSSWGNCGDGRIRPHVVAPGEWTASANYGRTPGQREYISPRLTWGSGTSSASPRTAGACALLTEWWRRYNGGRDPSPAMLRALVVNGAEPIAAGGPIPNPVQGWGRLNVENIVDSRARRVCLDQADMLTHYGDKRAWEIRVADPQRTVKITLAWTDPPGPVGSGGSPESPTVVNRLGLRVEVGGQRYCGNQFADGWSTPGGPQEGDGNDNLQNVYVAPGAAGGRMRVEVVALNLTTDCLTGAAGQPQQDFALVIANGVIEAAAPGAVLVGVDDQAGGGPPTQPGGFWAAGDDDGAELGQPVAPPPADAHTGDDGGWWGDSYSFPRGESGTGADPAALEQAVADGAGLVGAGGGHRVLVLGDRAAAEAGGQGVPADGARQQSLAALLARAEREVGGVGTRATVLVVGAGTRVTRADLAAMRRLAFGSELYLVSDSAELLAFLAQRIHDAQGLRLRLAPEPAALPRLLRDTLAEAGGAQEVVLAAIPGDAAGRAFQIVDDDRRVSLRACWDGPAGRLALRLPDGTSFPLSQERTAAGVSVRSLPGELAVELERTTGGAIWAGEWRVWAEGGAAVEVWAWGGPPISVGWREAPAPEAGAAGTMTLAVSAPGAALAEAEVAVTQLGPAIEVGGPLVLRPAAGGAGGATAESGATPALAGSIPLPQAPGMPAAATLTVTAQGADEAGRPFARRVRADILRPVPRSAWRRQVEAAGRLTLVAARVAAVRYEAGAVVGVRVASAERTCELVVASPELQRLLGSLDLERLGGDLYLGVRGGELVGVVRAC